MAVPTTIKIILSLYFFSVSMFLSKVGPADTTTAVLPLNTSLIAVNGISFRS